MEKPDTFLSFEDFHSRCEKEAQILEKELGRFLLRKQDWDLVFCQGNPTIRFDPEGGYTIGVILPAGLDGWRVYIKKN